MRRLNAALSVSLPPARIRVVLVYPNLYSVGMSNLGFQTVYRFINDIDHVVCERAFLPEQDAGKIRRVLTVESQTAHRRFRHHCLFDLL